jgi:hypothetical protein
MRCNSTEIGLDSLSAIQRMCAWSGATGKKCTRAMAKLDSLDSPGRVVRYPRGLLWLLVACLLLACQCANKDFHFVELNVQVPEQVYHNSFHRRRVTTNLQVLQRGLENAWSRG